MHAQALLTRRSRFAAALVLGLGVLAAGAGAGGAGAAAQPASGTVTTLATFTTPGTYVWTVPTGVKSVTFDVFGARGGGVVYVNHNVVTVVSQGGAGGEAKGKFTVHGGQVFEIVVGGQGGLATEGQSGNSAGGSNGGGDGSQYSADGGGGGASDVRIGGRGNSSCAGAMTCGYGDRIIVAGGGGGGIDVSGGNGYPGGGLTGGGATCQTTGASATQECAGSGPPCGPPVITSGGFGPGGDGCDTGSGGGGGGWYGGAGSGQGGGGSGFISPLSKSGSFPGGPNPGDGKVIITTTA